MSGRGLRHSPHLIPIFPHLYISIWRRFVEKSRSFICNLKATNKRKSISRKIHTITSSSRCRILSLVLMFHRAGEHRLRLPILPSIGHVQMILKTKHSISEGMKNDRIKKHMEPLIEKGKCLIKRYCKFIEKGIIKDEPLLFRYQPTILPKISHGKANE